MTHIIASSALRARFPPKAGPGRTTRPHQGMGYREVSEPGSKFLAATSFPEEARLLPSGPAVGEKRALRALKVMV